MSLSFARQYSKPFCKALTIDKKESDCLHFHHRHLYTRHLREQHHVVARAEKREKYLGSDGRRKASLEDAAPNFQQTNSDADSLDSEDKSTWSFGWQVSERNLAWNDDLKARLVRKIAATELECSAEVLSGRLKALQGVLPTLAQRVHTMKPEVVAQLCAQPDIIAERLIHLKSVFPSANVEVMALKSTDLLLRKSAESIEVAAHELRSFLPREVNVDRLCEQHPSSLEVPSFKAAVNEVKRLIPSLNLATALNVNPEIIFSTQRHNDMIPYDPVPGQS